VSQLKLLSDERDSVLRSEEKVSKGILLSNDNLLKNVVVNCCSLFPYGFYDGMKVLCNLLLVVKKLRKII